MNLPQTILAAQAAAEAHRKPIPRPTVSAEHVAQVLDRLPTKAKEALERDPTAVAFSMGTWDALDPAHAALFEDVAEALGGQGIEVQARAIPVHGRLLPCEILVTYESLARAADVIVKTREDWLDTARRLWGKRFGGGSLDEGGEVNLEPGPFGDVLAFLAPELSAEDADWFTVPGRRPERPAWRTGTDFYEHDPREMVQKALAELQLPLWRFEDVEKLWKELTGDGAVSRSRNLYAGSTTVHGPSIIFSEGERQRTYLVEEVLDATAEQLVDEVLLDPIWASAPAVEAHAEEAHAVEEHAEEVHAAPPVLEAPKGTKQSQKGDKPPKHPGQGGR